MKRFLSVLLAVCTVLTTLCILPEPAVAQSTKTPVSAGLVEESVTLPVEEEPISLETLTEDCNILQYVDEEAFEAADHAFRLPYLEELDTYVFQNTDGTRSIYYLYENVKYIDEQGNIREKDNTLQREAKGFRITENEFDLLLPHAITDGVELTYQGYDVKLIPATEGKLTATAPGTLQDNSVVYESFFGAGTSLVYTPLLSGVKEEIILEEYLPNRSFSFLLYTNGLYVTESEGGYILTQTKTSSEAVLYLGDIVVYDAVGRPSLGNLTVKTVKAGDVYTLIVSADEAFLADPATVYPVTIDPDLTISDTNNGSGAIEDTTLFSGTPNLNTGDWVYNTAGYVDDTYGAGRILVRLPGLYNSTVFQSLTADQIISATFYTTKSSSKTPDYVNLYRYTDSTWGETTATWNNAANLYATDGNLGTSSTSSSTVIFDITTLVRAWRNYYLVPSAGFMLVNQDETNVTKKFGIYSAEYSNVEKRPYVVLNYSGTIWLHAATMTMGTGDTSTLIAITDPPGGIVRWSSSNEAVATVSAGVVSAHALGFTTITATYVDANQQPHTAECVVLVIPLAEGTYFLQNRQTGIYADVAEQIATAGALVQQWDFHGGATQKWELTYVSNGYYTLHLENAGSMYYMGVEGNSQITDSNIVLRTGVVDDGMLWRFESTTDGAFRLIPKLAEAQTTERALVATTSNDTNGDRLAYGNYVANNGSYRDEWYVRCFMLFVDHYYDNGYDERFGNSCGDIIAYQEICSEILRKIFAIRTVPSVHKYASCADSCTGLPVSLTDTTVACAHSSAEHKTREALKTEIVANSGPGTATTTKVLWTGHVLESRSSCTYTNDQVIVVTIGRVTDETNTNCENSVIRYQRIYTLLHEISHALGAPDHYCYDETSSNCNNPTNDCWRCDRGLSKKPSCLMTWRIYDLEQRLIENNLEDLYCAQCMSSTHIKGVFTHLTDHH